MSAGSSNGGGAGSTIRWQKDPDGIVVLTLDDPSQSANTMNQAYMDSMATPCTLLKYPGRLSTGASFGPPRGPPFLPQSIRNLPFLSNFATRVPVYPSET